MKTKLTQRRFRAQKASACSLCKPYKRGWEDKKPAQDLRNAVKHEQELREVQTLAPSSGKEQSG